MNVWLRGCHWPPSSKVVVPAARRSGPKIGCCAEEVEAGRTCRPPHWTKDWVEKPAPREGTTSRIEERLIFRSSPLKALIAPETALVRAVKVDTAPAASTVTLRLPSR